MERGAGNEMWTASPLLHGTNLEVLDLNWLSKHHLLIDTLVYVVIRLGIQIEFTQN